MDEQTHKDKRDWLNGNTFLTMNHVKNYFKNLLSVTVAWKLNFVSPLILAFIVNFHSLTSKAACTLYGLID